MSAGFSNLLPVDEEQYRANRDVLNSLRQLLETLEDKNNRGFQSYQDYSRQLEASTLPPEQKRAIYAQLRTHSFQLDPNQALRLASSAASTSRSRVEPATTTRVEDVPSPASMLARHARTPTAKPITNLRSANSTPSHSRLASTNASQTPNAAPGNSRQPTAPIATPPPPVNASNRTPAQSTAQSSYQFEMLARSWANNQPPGSFLYLPQLDKRVMRLFKLPDCQVVIQQRDGAGMWINLDPTKAPTSLKALNDISVQSWKKQQAMKTMTVLSAAPPSTPPQSTRVSSSLNNSRQGSSYPLASIPPTVNDTPSTSSPVPPQSSPPPISHNVPRLPPQPVFSAPSATPLFTQKPAAHYPSQQTFVTNGAINSGPYPAGPSQRPAPDVFSANISAASAALTQPVPVASNSSLGASGSTAPKPSEADIRYLARDVLRACGKTGAQKRPRSSSLSNAPLAQKLKPANPSQTRNPEALVPPLVNGPTLPTRLPPVKAPLPAPSPPVGAALPPQPDGPTIQTSASLSTNTSSSAVSQSIILPQPLVPAPPPPRLFQSIVTPSVLKKQLAAPSRGPAIAAPSSPPGSPPKSVEVIDVDNWMEDELLLTNEMKGHQSDGSSSSIRNESRPSITQISASKGFKSKERFLITPVTPKPRTPPFLPKTPTPNVNTVATEQLSLPSPKPKRSEARYDSMMVLMPSPPDWVRQDLERERRAWRKVVARDPQKTFEDSLDNVERAIFDASWRVRRERPCDWESCGAILNSAESLSKHVRQHIAAGATMVFCQWKGCTRSTKNLNLKEHLWDHIRSQFYCPHEGCDESYNNLKFLGTHINQSHRMNYQKRLHLNPTRFVPKMPLHLGGTAPRYLALPPFVRKPAISIEEHNDLAPWVLQQIVGRIEYTLDATIKGVKSKDLMALDVMSSHQEYDFLSCPEKVYDNNPRRRRVRGRFANIPSSEATTAIAQGLVLFPGSGDRRDRNLERTVENTSIRNQRH